MSLEELLRNSSSGKVLLPLAPSIYRNPSALDMGLALKPSAFTAGSASHVKTVLLCLVSTVLAAQAS